jgi:hypothetical protein
MSSLSDAVVTFLIPIVVLDPKGRFLDCATVSFSERYDFPVDKLSLNKQVTLHLYDQYTFTINKNSANEKIALH